MLISSSNTLASSITDAETTCRGVFSTLLQSASETSASLATAEARSGGGLSMLPSSSEPPASLRTRFVSFSNRSSFLLSSRSRECFRLKTDSSSLPKSDTSRARSRFSRCSFSATLIARLARISSSNELGDCASSEAEALSAVTDSLGFGGFVFCAEDDALQKVKRAKMAISLQILRAAGSGNCSGTVGKILGNSSMSKVNQIVTQPFGLAQQNCDCRQRLKGVALRG